MESLARKRKRPPQDEAGVFILISRALRFANRS